MSPDTFALLKASTDWEDRARAAISSSPGFEPNKEASLLRDVEWKRDDLLGAIHDIDGTCRQAFACQAKALDRARCLIQEAVELVREHLAGKVSP